MSQRQISNGSHSYRIWSLSKMYRYYWQSPALRFHVLGICAQENIIEGLQYYIQQSMHALWDSNKGATAEDLMCDATSLTNIQTAWRDGVGACKNETQENSRQTRQWQRAMAMILDTDRTSTALDSRHIKYTEHCTGHHHEVREQSRFSHFGKPVPQLHLNRVFRRYCLLFLLARFALSRCSKRPAA